MTAGWEGSLEDGDLCRWIIFGVYPDGFVDLHEAQRGVDLASHISRAEAEALMLEWDRAYDAIVGLLQELEKHAGEDVAWEARMKLLRRTPCTR